MIIPHTEIQNEILRRRDMREAFTFTIDPADAKDFDDALSFEIIKCSNDSINDQMVNDKMVHYQIGVHIADVSFYVRPDTQVDEEAYRRGTSIYLVDRVIPMLPEELCNDKCSLRPNEDKLCMSVIFTFEVPLNAEGAPDYSHARILKHKICRTVIRSNARLNYDEAQAIIGPMSDQCRSNVGSLSGDGEVSAGLKEAIATLNALAQKLRTERLLNGALAIEQDEMRFRLDEHHHPVEIYFERPNEAHHLIEEFMLLANRTVATAVGSGRPFVYRVHDLPDAEKLEEVQAFKNRFASRTGSSRYAGRSAEGFKRAIEMLTIRAQAKAVYSTYNIGHYGLAFSHYTHFTSPIRRYPDLMVHRLVEKYILTGKKISLTREELEEKCEHCSACEQEAAQAERESVKMFQALWMSDHIGEIHTGYVSGITDFGLFVQLDENRCEGLIHISKIGDIRKYELGDTVTVKVVQTDVNRAFIDFEFA